YSMKKLYYTSYKFNREFRENIEISIFLTQEKEDITKWIIHNIEEYTKLFYGWNSILNSFNTTQELLNTFPKLAKYAPKEEIKKQQLIPVTTIEKCKQELDTPSIPSDPPVKVSRIQQNKAAKKANPKQV